MADSVDELRKAVERLHGGQAVFREVVGIAERLDERSVWSGQVYVFDLIGHPAAVVTYAWSTAIQDSDQRQLYVVLGVPPIDSPMDAVRSVIGTGVTGESSRRLGRFQPRRDSVMQVEYARDDTRRRVVVKFQGHFEVSVALALFERHRIENDWSYGRLYDARALTGKPTPDALRLFMSLDTQYQPHGAEAIVATDSGIYASACSYSALGRSTLSIAVFRDADEAERWLTVHD